MPVQSIAKNIPISPRKVGLVASLVRNRNVEDALSILDYVPKKASLAVKKTILSAKANALHNHNYIAKDLKIIEISISPARSLKRYRPAARGRALPFKRKYSHIRVVIEGNIRSKKTESEIKTNKTEADKVKKSEKK